MQERFRHDSTDVQVATTTRNSPGIAKARLDAHAAGTRVKHKVATFLYSDITAHPLQNQGAEISRSSNGQNPSRVRKPATLRV